MRAYTYRVIRTALSWWAIPFSGILLPSPWWDKMDFCHLQKLSRDLSAWWLISRLGCKFNTSNTCNRVTITTVISNLYSLFQCITISHHRIMSCLTTSKHIVSCGVVLRSLNCIVLSHFIMWFPFVRVVLNHIELCHIVFSVWKNAINGVLLYNLLTLFCGIVCHAMYYRVLSYCIILCHIRLYCIST